MFYLPSPFDNRALVDGLTCKVALNDSFQSVQHLLRWSAPRDGFCRAARSQRCSISFVLLLSPVTTKTKHNAKDARTPPAQQGSYARYEKSVTETWFEIGVLSCAFEEKRRKWMQLRDDKSDPSLYYGARENRRRSQRVSLCACIKPLLYRRRLTSTGHKGPGAFCVHF